MQRQGLQCVIQLQLVVRKCETEISRWYDIKPLTGSLCSWIKESGNISVVVGHVNKFFELALKNRFQSVSLFVANVHVAELLLAQQVSVSEKNVSREMLPGKIEFFMVAVPMYEDLNADEVRTLTQRSPLELVGSVTCENA